MPFWMTERHKAERETLRKELSELRVELGRVGIFDELYGGHLRNSPKLPLAVPILLKHLGDDYSDSAMVCILGNLDSRIPEVQDAWPKFAEIYPKLSDGKGIRFPGDTEEWPLLAKDACANLLINSFTNKYLEDMMDLVRDPHNGGSRVILLQVFRRRRKRPEVQAFLKEMLKDPDLFTELSAWKPPIS